MSFDEFVIAMQLVRIMTLLRDNLANTELLQRMEDRSMQPDVISLLCCRLHAVHRWVALVWRRYS